MHITLLQSKYLQMAFNETCKYCSVEAVLKGGELCQKSVQIFDALFKNFRVEQDTIISLWNSLSKRFSEMPPHNYISSIFSNGVWAISANIARYGIEADEDLIKLTNTAKRTIIYAFTLIATLVFVPSLLRMSGERVVFHDFFRGQMIIGGLFYLYETWRNTY